jgi:hypothetical protein
MSKRNDFHRQPNNGRPLWEAKSYRADVQDPFKSQKKHYGSHHESEINRFAVMKGVESINPQIQNPDFPRNLATYDIPGAIPGRKMTKETTPLRSPSQDYPSGYDNREQKGYPQRRGEDSLDRFKKEYEIQEKQGKRDGGQLRSSYVGDNIINNMNNNRSETLPYKEEMYQPIREDYTIKQDTADSYDPYIPPTNNRGRDYSAKPKKSDHVPFSNLLNIAPNQRVDNKTPDIQSNRQFDMGREQYDTESMPKRYEWRNPESIPMYKLPERPIVSSNRDNDITQNISNNVSSISQLGGSPQKSGVSKNVVTYNIISNNPVPRNLPNNTRLPFKYALDFETTRINDMKRNSMPVAVDNSNNYTFDHNPNPMKQQSSPVKDFSKIDDQYGAGGKNNIFAENNNYGYSNKGPYVQQEQNDQFVNPKSLKNLSGIRIY